LFLIGFMGAGKSTVGRLAAGRLRLPFVDLDTEIAKQSGRSIPEIFESDGEAGFRMIESATLASLAVVPASVVACGGGVVLDEHNRAALRSMGAVVYLHVSVEEAIARVGDASGRPMLAGSAAATAAALLRSREALYERTADVQVSTTGRAPIEIAADVVAFAKERAA
jgi:shikimate kinase